MAEESGRPYKKMKNDKYLSLVKGQQETVAPKITNVATKILLDDARTGFKKGNFVCSPFSLEIVLGMLAFGATGKTLEQLLEFLGHETLDQLRSESPTSNYFAQILANPNVGDGSPRVNLANGVWVAKKQSPVRLLSSYKEVLNTVYNTKAQFFDFENKAKAIRTINSWADKKTNGLIPTVLTENDLTGKEDLVFANALYFMGRWSNPFEANETKEKKFKLINGKTILAPFMTNYNKFYYGSFSGYSMLKIPYKRGHSNKSFSMYIFLPDRKDGLQDLLQMFYSDNDLFYGNFVLKEHEMEEVWIPKFKITSKFEAHDVMETMGLTLPFDPTNKEITEIVGRSVYVTNVLQKSFIEIDERGTEAAAVSIVTMLGCCRPPTPPPPASFVADHPFMFMIREHTSRAVFFVGVVLNPVENSLA